LLQHVSDHKRSIIRELYTVLGYNYSNGSIMSVDMDVVGVMAAYAAITPTTEAYIGIPHHPSRTTP
jgi:hypothetical protein